MTRDRALLDDFKEKDGLNVVFGDNILGKTKGYGTIRNDAVNFSRVAYVEGLKYNQLCNKRHQLIFLDNEC